jgi:hypothetical protein
MIKSSDALSRIDLAIDVIDKLNEELGKRYNENSKLPYINFFSIFIDRLYLYKVNKFIKEANDFKDLLKSVCTFEDEIDVLNMFNDFLALKKEFLIKMFKRNPLDSKEDPEDLYNIFTYGGVV